MKITEQLKQEMCELRKTHTLQEIADKFSCSVSFVWRYTKGATCEIVSNGGSPRGKVQINLENEAILLNLLRELRKTLTLNQISQLCGKSPCWVHQRTLDTSRLNQGQTKSPLYGTWKSIRARCTKPSACNYKYYGAKGITLYGPWLNFSTFEEYILTNLGPRPEKHTLCRIDTKGNYVPGNLKWSSSTERSRNRQVVKNNTILFLGKERTVAEISDITGLSRATIRHYKYSPQTLLEKYRLCKIPTE